jgi:phospholipase/lecithinase/hemolysin
MTGRYWKNFIKSWLIVGMLLAPDMVSAQVEFDEVVVFGTSLSDSGNAFALTGLQNTPPFDTLDFLIIPDAPYAIGGHHFLNGYTWVEQLARPLGLASDTRASFNDANPRAVNYAIGGTRILEVPEKPFLDQQVGAYLTDFGNVASPQALYAVEMGSNDIRDALSAAGGELWTLQQALDYLSDAAETLKLRLTMLHTAGARKFLVLNVPPIGETPAIKSMGAQASGLANFLSDHFNSELSNRLDDLEDDIADISITRLNVHGIVMDIIGSPSDYGLTEVSQACLTPGVAPYSCTDPDNYFFWDGVHPTKTVHSIFSQEAVYKLATP